MLKYQSLNITLPCREKAKEYQNESMCLTEQLPYMGITVSTILFRGWWVFTIRPQQGTGHISPNKFQRTILHNETEAKEFNTVKYFSFLTKQYLMFEKASYCVGLCSSNALDFYSGGAWFKSYLGHWLSQLRFLLVFFSPSWQMLGLGHNCFLLNIYPNLFTCISTIQGLCSQRHWYHHKLIIPIK